MGVVVALPAARASSRRVPARRALGDRAGRPGARLVLVDDEAKAALERGWELAMAAALGQLPSGACLTVRDSEGREWDVSPAARVRAASFGEAV